METQTAWEHIAEWTQDHLDASESLFRLGEARRTCRLLTAYRSGVTAAADLAGLCRPHHDGKSTGLAAERLRPDDTAGWDTPWRTLTDPPPEPFDPAPRELLPEPDDGPCPF